MFRNCLIVFCCFVIVACGGGSNSESSTPPVIAPPVPSFTIAGAGIKGPLSHADVKLYRFDSNSALTQGELVAQATTNNQAAIEGLTVLGDLDAYYVLEFNSTESTIDLSTQAAPILNNFRTLINAEQIESETPIFASPLSSLTLAVAKLEMDKGTALEDALTFAEQRVKSYFGLGLNTEIQFLNARAMLSGNESSVEDQLKAQEMRRAIEGFSMVTSQILSSLSEASLSEDELIEQFALDLDDGALDAIASGESELSYGVEQIQLFESLLDAFELPNTNGLTLKELPQVMVNETSRTLGEPIDAPEFLSVARYSTHNHFALKADLDGDGLDNLIDEDDDNDSVFDKDDAFPSDASEYLDTDADGIGDNKDSDDDGDGYPDSEDDFPLERSEWIDTDQDGIGNNADSDDDNDSVVDVDDAFPLDSSETTDTDLDSIGNNKDADDDGDGYPDSEDDFPLERLEWIDTDQDGVGNNADSDDDNDGVYDNDDELPLDSSESLDFDKDGIGDIADNDDDNDSVMDSEDRIHVAFPQPASFVEEEQFEFKVRGYDVNNNRLVRNDGWHVQYSIIDADRNKPVSFYAENFLYNADYAASNQEWEVSIPAPFYSGDFTLDVTLYCSREQDGCNGSLEYKQLINFTVECTKSECGYQPLPEPGRNISATTDRSILVDTHLQENGNILVAYIDFSEDDAITYIAQSTDKGNSWTRTSKLPETIISGYFLTLETMETAILGKCGTSYCLFKTTDNINWTTTDLVSSSNFANCHIENCDINYLHIKSVEKSDSGEFQVIYGKGGEVDYRKQQTYLTTTTDFLTWSEAQPIMGEYTVEVSDILQLPDGSYVAVVFSFEDHRNRLLSSDDGLTWEEVAQLNLTQASFHYDNGLVMFYQSINEIFKVRFDENYEASEPTQVYKGANLSFCSELIEPNTFGLFYDLELNFQVDVFFETYKEE